MRTRPICPRGAESEDFAVERSRKRRRVNSREAESHMLFLFAGNEEVSTPQGKELTVSHSDGAETQSLAA